MALILTCAKCAQRLSIPDEMRGKQVRCPKCKEVYTVDRKTAPVQRPPSPAAPGARRPASPAEPARRPAPTIQDTARPRTIRCPKCSVQMRLPTHVGTSTFRCSKCATQLTVRSPQGSTPAQSSPPKPSPDARSEGSKPAAVRAPASPRPANAAAGDSIFGDLPTSPMVSHRGLGGGAAPLGHNPYAALPSSGAIAIGRAAASRGGSSKLLWQGLLIAIPNALALLFVGLTLLLSLRVDPSKAGAPTVILVIFGVVAIHFLVVLAGAIGMIIGVPRWLSIVTCVVAIVPVMLICGPCVGLLLYPFALGGAVWGLIRLFGSSPATASSMGGGYVQSALGPPTNVHPARGHLQQAEWEANQNSSSGGESGSMTGTIAYLAGGFVFLGMAVAAVVLLCLVFMGKVEAQRPFKAIAGAIFCGSTGFSLLAKGISRLQNRR